MFNLYFCVEVFKWIISKIWLYKLMYLCGYSFIFKGEYSLLTFFCFNIPTSKRPKLLCDGFYIEYKRPQYPINQMKSWQKKKWMIARERMREREEEKREQWKLMEYIREKMRQFERSKIFDWWLHNAFLERWVIAFVYLMPKGNM